MVRQLTRALAAILVVGSISIPAMVQAQEDGVSQCKFARDLAMRIGLTFPNTATPEDIFGMLMAEGIVPKDGWECSKILTVGDFARLIVQVLERSTGETLVADDQRGDDNAFIEAAKAANYNLESIEETLGGMQTLEERTGPGVNREQSTTDPSDAREVFGQPDERASGTDVSLNAATTFPNNNILDALAPPVVTPVVPVVTPTTRRSTAPVLPATVARVVRQLPSEIPGPTTANRPR